MSDERPEELDADRHDEEMRKQQMIDRLGGSSFLVFFFDHWFGVAAVIFLLLVTFLGLFLPRIWTQTPSGFAPVLKVSGLDLWQARSLRNSAIKDAKAGRANDALHAWRSAIANNPADFDLLRGGLGFVADQKPAPKEHLGFAVNYGFWLLRLGGTNANDAELVLRILSNYEMGQYVVRLGETMEDKLTPVSARLLARAYFEQSRIPQFDRLWLKREADFTNDVELVLYRQAWKANWGPPATLQEGREALRAAAGDPKLRTLALRLQLQVSYVLRDESGYGVTLASLKDIQQDRLTDHVLHWLLMSALGRRTEAREEASNFTVAPVNPAEANVMARALYTLGLTDNAIVFLDQQIRKFSFDPDLWRLQAENLINQKRWDELRTLAFAIRSELSLQAQLDGFAHFLEAYAESNLERPEAARAAAERVLKSQTITPELARLVATKIRDMGFADISIGLLRNFEGAFKDDPKYWFERTVAGFMSGNTDDLILSAQKAYALSPNDLNVMHNYAASLLVLRKNPAETVNLTLRVLLQRPEDLGCQLNHAMALLQNERLEDAAELLRRMNTLTMTPLETALYHFCWFEYHYSRKDWASARVSYGKVDSQRLMQPQAAWFEKQFRAIPEG